MSTDLLQYQGFPKKFPCGEIHVRTIRNLAALRDGTGMIWIEKRIQNSDDIMEILMLADAIRRDYVGNKDVRLALRIPYVPYSRQDRVMVPGESLSIKVFADLINSVKFDMVEIWDPHSDVTTALLNNCKVVSQPTLLVQTLDNLGQRIGFPFASTFLVCPDAGARKKILKCKEILASTGVIYADKIRDATTGAIIGTSIDMSSALIPHNDDIQDLLIVDDICDGGRTFVEISKALRSNTHLYGIRYRLHLYVTHGFFTQGIAGLFDHFATIGCANLMNSGLTSNPSVPEFYYYSKV